ncbi:MAG: 3-oxoacyl-ACP reductase [Lentisphaerae bacterium GWF2_44_16]|nr:MAG: 3-oxoacyl-ACP reductase [Lentisphaerae bacterium GWF2_44_16]
MNIKDSSVVITGAGNGLGKKTALDLSLAGARVFAADLNEKALKELHDESGCKIKYCVCDVSNEKSVQALFSEACDVDILINNAGITRDGLMIKVKDGETKVMPLSDFMSVINVNLTGVFLCAREAAKIMAGKKHGLIINISSVSRAGNMGQTNYSAAKAGVDAMTVTWSKELARYNIRCAAIAPGYIGTEMVKAINPVVLEKIVNQMPLKRLGEPEEISKTVKFIIENDFVNGRILEIDGGLRI